MTTAASTPPAPPRKKAAASSTIPPRKKTSALQEMSPDKSSSVVDVFPYGSSEDEDEVIVMDLLHDDGGDDNNGGGKISPVGRSPFPYPPLPQYPPWNPHCPLGEVKMRECLPVLIPEDGSNEKQINFSKQMITPPSLPFNLRGILKSIEENPIKLGASGEEYIFKLLLWRA